MTQPQQTACDDVWTHKEINRREKEKCELNDKEADLPDATCALRGTGETLEDTPSLGPRLLIKNRKGLSSYLKTLGKINLTGAVGRAVSRNPIASTRPCEVH